MSIFQDNVKGKVSIVNAIYKWKLADFCIGCKEFGSQHWSPVFHCNNSKWQIQLFPRGDCEETKEYLSIYLWLRGGESVEATYEFSIVNNKNEVTVLFKDKQKFATKKGQGSNKFIKQDALIDKRNGFLVNNTMKILCKISVDETKHTIKKTSDCSPNKRLRLSSESHNRESSFEKFYKNEQLSDVKFVTSCGRSIHAHKTILANKSEVFMAMFAKSSEEKVEAIEVHDIDYEILEEMFRYIYTNDILDLSKHANKLLVVAVKYGINSLKLVCEENLCKSLSVENVKLLVVAVKYGINSLKLICEENLCKSLSVENVIDGLVTARSYNLVELEKQAIDFIALHMKDLVNEPAFKSVTSLHEDVLMEIFRRTVDQNK